MVVEDPPRAMRVNDEARALIRSRIEEKRLFEARFLCRKLDRELAAEQRLALERTLNESLGQIEQLRQQAKAMMVRGEFGQAGQLYDRIETIAIDVPGVDEEKKALAGAEALAARLREPVEEEINPGMRLANSAETGPEDEQPQPAALARRPPLLKKRRISLGLWLAFGLTGVVLAALLALFFGQRHEPVHVAPVAAPSSNRIVLQPLLQAVPEQTIAPPPSKGPQASAVQPPPLPPPSSENKPKASVSPALKLGRLQIEQSEQR